MIIRVALVAASLKITLLTRAAAAAMVAAALARSISRAIAVEFAADDATTTRARFGDVHTRNVDAHVCDDARPMSLRVAHITKNR